VAVSPIPDSTFVGGPSAVPVTLMTPPMACAIISKLL
jgi:hypothetical protein